MIANNLTNNIANNLTNNTDNNLTNDCYQYFLKNQCLLK